jgi:hypothetical protein
MFGAREPEIQTNISKDTFEKIEPGGAPSTQLVMPVQKREARLARVRAEVAGIHVFLP